MKNYFSVDLGATSGRTMLASFDGTKVNLKEVTRFPNPIIHLGGHLFWDLPYLYNQILLGLKKVADESVAIESIGIDTWGVDFAFFGSDGQLLGLPYCYRDAHTDDAMEKFFERVPSKEVYDRTGIQFMCFNSLFQLDTLRRNSSSSLAAAAKILFTPDALSYMLTGEAVCEYTIASTSQLLNPQTGDLDNGLLDAVGLKREQFGRLVQPGTVVGTLTPQVQEFTGLGAVKVVAVAGHDTASAVASVPAATKNYAYLSCGTWSLLGIESPKPIINEKSFAHNFTNEGGVEGTTRFLKNICGLWLFEQCRKEFKGVPDNVGELAAFCETTDFNSLIDPDDPAFAHPVSMTAAITEYCNAHGLRAPQTPAEYIRCIFKSLARRYREVVDIFEKDFDFQVECLHVIGGGSQNRFLMQYAADELGRPVICGPTEGTALGNALLQIKADGLVDSIAAMRRVSASSVELKVYNPNK